MVAVRGLSNAATPLELNSKRKPWASRFENVMSRRVLRVGVISLARQETYGGSSVIAGTIGQEMARRGHEVHFISADLPRGINVRRSGIHFHEVQAITDPALPSGMFPYFLRSAILRACQQHELDILHAHYGVPPAAEAVNSSRMMGRRAPTVVTTLHGTDVTTVGHHPVLLPITRDAVLQSDRVTVPSVFLKDAAYQYLQLPRSRSIDVISNFVDAERYRPGPKVRPSLDGVFGAPLDPEVPLFVHASNFRPVKRATDVVRVFQHIVKVRPAKLVFIGDGPDRPEAEQLVRHLGLESEVVFVGKVDDFTDILQRADAFLLPSETESFGLAALEAMSCGTPVVAYETGGLVELVSEGVNGFLCKLGDAEGMANHCLFIVGRPPKERSAMRRAARTTATQRFSLGEAMDAYERLYWDIAAPMTARRRAK